MLGTRPAVVLALSEARDRGQHSNATTLWLFHEKLAKAGLIEKLFDRFDQHLAAKGSSHMHEWHRHQDRANADAAEQS